MGNEKTIRVRARRVYRINPEYKEFIPKALKILEKSKYPYSR